MGKVVAGQPCHAADMTAVVSAVNEAIDTLDTDGGVSGSVNGRVTYNDSDGGVRIIGVSLNVQLYATPPVMPSTYTPQT